MRAPHLAPGWAALVAGVLAGLLAGDARPFALFPQDPAPDAATALAQATRWSSLSGLDDGLQVAVEPGFAADLGAFTPVDRAALEQAVRDGLAMWETPALAFEASFEDPGAVEGTGAGSEVDVFAVPSTHPVFAGTDFFGFTAQARFFSASRPLTNGQSAPGWVMTRADVYVNRDLVLFLANQFGWTQPQRLAALTRLVAHEVGHALGLGHANGNNPFGVQTSYDLDAVATNPIVIDAEDPFAGFAATASRDDAAIMSNRPCGHPFVAPCAALFDGALHADDAGGRDALYPAVLPVAPGAVVASGPSYVVVSDPGSGATDRLFSGSPLTAADGVAIDPSGDVLVADSGSGAIVRIDAQTGASSTTASGGDLHTPIRLVVGPDGTLYAVDIGSGGSIVAVDPALGTSSLLATVPDAFDLAIDPAGSALHVAAGDAVVKIALPDGAPSVLASGGLMTANLGIAVEASGSVVVATDNLPSVLVRVSADGATQTLLHTSASAAAYYDLALDADGQAVVADVGTNALLRIDLATGAAATADSLVLPFGVAPVLPICADGLDNDGDGRWDAAGTAPDGGCTGPEDEAETQAGLACDDGIDNDGDGFTDFRPSGGDPTDPTSAGDPGCQTAASLLENPQCDNDLDDDGDGFTDWNGPDTPDPQCAGLPWRNLERPITCGLGAELALLLPVVGVLARRWPRRRRR